MSTDDSAGRRAAPPGETGVLARAGFRLERLLGENAWMLLLAAVVGVLGGLGAAVFRWAIDACRWLSLTLRDPQAAGGIIDYLWGPGTSGAAALESLSAAPWYWKVLPPAVGGLIVGPLVWFLAREARGHGIPEVLSAVSDRGGRIRKRVMAIKTLASAVTIGTGGSAGREGPIVQIGASIGSGIGQALGFDGNRLIVLLGCGAAAGMAATFNAPLAGVILAVEVIIGAASVRVLSPLVVASVMGTFVARILFGDHPAFLDVPEYELVAAVELPLYVLLGLLAGGVALLFTSGIVLIEDLWERVPLPGWATPVLGGAIVGAIALGFPEVLGVGYETIDVALQGQGALRVLALLVLLKILATGTTLGSGGSGGVFAPSLFVGACLGGAFGMGLEALLPGQTAHSGAYALVGMGAVLAGTTHAPITAILMLFELTGNYAIILPLMLACILSTVLASRVLPTSIFTTRLQRRGVRLRGSGEADLMRSTRVRRILRPFPDTIPPELPLPEVMRRALGGAMLHLYVVDPDHRPLGVITLRRLKALFREEWLDDPLLVAADVMKSPVTAVGLDDTLDAAMAHFARLDVEMLPVTDEEGRLAGCITRHDMVVFFEQEILRDDGLGMKFVMRDRPDDAEFIELPEGHRLVPIEVTGFLAGKTLRELDLRATMGLNVVGIRRRTPEGIERVAPEPRRPLASGEILVIAGPSAAIDSFKKAIA
jgi:CIC family chloride channel protein